MTLRNISDTARWVAMYRAMESERPDALFHDPYARRLAGERGEAILAAMPRGRESGWSMVVRTQVLDEIVLRLTSAEAGAGAATVLNLACGLDTRPYRLPLPAGLRWIEVDLPEIVDYKEAELAAERPRCALERVRLDLADRAARRDLLARVGGIGSIGGTVLTITEGLLVYLREDDVRDLAADLAAQGAMRWWAADLVSPFILRFLQRSWGKSLDEAGAPLRFAPAEGAAFFRRLGWEPVELHPFLTEARRLHREMSFSWLRRALAWLTPDLRRQALQTGIALFERRPAER